MSKILVVDDSPTALKLVTQTLATTGHHLITAGDGEEAVQKATSGAKGRDRAPRPHGAGRRHAT